MKTTIIILAIVAIMAGAGATASLIPIHQVSAQNGPPFSPPGPPPNPPNPNAEHACDTHGKNFHNSGGIGRVCG